MNTWQDLAGGLDAWASVVHTRLMALDPQLLELLACPEDHGPLWYFEHEGFLYNPRLKRKYLVTDDVPVLLVSEAISLSDAEHAHIETLAQANGMRATFTP